MSKTGSNITSGFIDLATYDEVDSHQYGKDDRTYTYFVRQTMKSTWFTQVPVMLSKNSGTAGFNQEWSASISRAGDYLLHAWLRITLPQVTLNAGNVYGADGRIRWTKNIMHNLIRECSITFNDLTAQRFDNYFLDFWSAFTVPAGKRVGYDNMIGNIDSLISPHEPDSPLPSKSLNLPLPFFFSRDSGVALPTAAIPYNEMKISFNFRDWSDLLILENSIPVAGVNPAVIPQVPTDISTIPEIKNSQVWGNYAIVSNEERDKMGCSARHILIEQVQTSPIQNYSPETNPNQQYDIRFSHSIKVLFYGVRNKTNKNIWSNYTTASPVPGPQTIIYEPDGSYDPISHVTLTYESSNRFSAVGSDFFSLIEPYYKAPAIPEPTGYHMYSYSLDFNSVDPKGSTNFGKLTNVSIVPEASQAAITGAEGGGDLRSGQSYPQKFEFVMVGVNNIIISITGGALGFPIL